MVSEVAIGGEKVYRLRFYGWSGIFVYNFCPSAINLNLAHGHSLTARKARKYSFLLCPVRGNRFNEHLDILHTRLQERIVIGYYLQEIVED